MSMLKLGIGIGVGVLVWAGLRRRAQAASSPSQDEFKPVPPQADIPDLLNPPPPEAPPAPTPPTDPTQTEAFRRMTEQMKNFVGPDMTGSDKVQTEAFAARKREIRSSNQKVRVQILPHPAFRRPPSGATISEMERQARYAIQTLEANPPVGDETTGRTCPGKAKWDLVVALQEWKNYLDRLSSMNQDASLDTTHSLIDVRDGLEHMRLFIALTGRIQTSGPDSIKGICTGTVFGGLARGTDQSSSYYGHSYAGGGILGMRS